ncbi:CRISPR-associated protein Cas1 [Photobacterium marinum]|uniref:CRISPR-associated endonuclease Cas1 n=1 Tax=Photobacterium marinum TaxID=1056511 RepID=L8J6S5_9GAMM|nr:CRISPR-associated endonuclease Cas1 [Photobacterium marinum]ELR63893.1 CRISPR-associated protein Cas1 [Photobacterium marinum]
MSLYPLQIYAVSLQFTADTVLPFFHQPIVSGFLRTLLAIPDEVQNRLRIHTPESGRVFYSAGEHYRFYLFTLNLNDDYLGFLFEQLQQLPHSAEKAGCRGKLSTNFNLLSITDGLSGRELYYPQAACTIDHQSVLSEAEQWKKYANEHKRLTLRLLSPLRLKPENGKRLCRQGQDLSSGLVLNRSFDAYASVCDTLGCGRPQRKSTPAHGEMITNLHWSDCTYTTPSEQVRQMGGLLGNITLDCNKYDYNTWVYLVLGQYIGLGQNRNFGFGRYRLVGENGETALPDMPRAQTLTNTIFNYPNLEQAWLLESKKLPKKLHQSLPHEDFDQLYEQLHQGNYQTGLLTPRLLEKPGQKRRLLLLPPFIDKVAHKCLSRWLATSLDTLYSANSYGYRKGYSRLTAKDRISYLLSQGYKWVVDADIKAFFASIDRQQVAARLQALYGDDTLWPILDKMLNAAIDPNSELPLELSISGLNLGNSLSPILANLMLDHFDDVIREHKLELVRYADDFLILCREQQQANHAKDFVEQLLHSQALSLNPRKTRVTHVNKGFRFLGYLFINDLVIAVKHAEEAKTPEPPLLPPSESQCYFASQQQTICITGEPAYINCQGKRLHIQQHNQVQAKLPFAHIHTLILFGNHHITTPALKRLMKTGISVHFANQFGKHTGVAAALNLSPELHLIQAAKLTNTENRLHFAKKLVYAKIENQIQVLNQRLQPTEELKQTQHSLKNATTLKQCLGYEGCASKAYYQALAHCLPEGFLFNGRIKRNPPDPVNSMLSYGYSMLYSHIDSLLRAAGLYPTLGGYHQGRGQHAALASDLMEPFRFIVERTMLTALNRHQLKPDHFMTKEGQCRLTDAARKTWSKLLLDGLQRPNYHEGGKSYSVLDAANQQNSHFIRWLRSESTTFEPWSLKQVRR